VTNLFRASIDLTTEGRTLTGVAMPWDRPTMVRDMTGPAYLEAFSPSSADVTLRQNVDPRPVFKRHDYTQDPVGTVTFERSAEGLLFVAPLSKTRDADETLELVNDGAMRSVSIGFRPIKQQQRPMSEGNVTYRTEMALRELSLAPTGFGQYSEALVTAVRTEGEDGGTPHLDALRKRRAFLVIP
jgi:HK97 family phage prohead protease